MTGLALYRPRKRLFLGLATLSVLMAAVASFGLWRITAPGLAQIHGYLPWIVGVALGLVIAAIALGILGVVLAILGVPLLRIAQGLVWWAINFVFPVINLLGRVLDIERERIERSFIEVSNHLVRQRYVRVPADRVLILTPHCLQKDVCGHKVTQRVENCRSCGQCQVGDLLSLAKRRGVHLAIVPGGTLARKVIKSLRPKAVLAVACERDLVSGIQDVFPMPVIGVLNARPHGPCCNTRVDLARIEEGLDWLEGKVDGRP